jgi:hypothetical protein
MRTYYKIMIIKLNYKENYHKQLDVLRQMISFRRSWVKEIEINRQIYHII